MLLAALWPVATAAQPFNRVVEEVLVRDADGTAYTHPWLGGLNVPRPQFADLDGDGDPDLFLQERSGQLMFFENTGTAEAPRFAWRTDAFAGLDVGEWARLVDLDADGDLDVLAEERFSLVRLYRNTGTPRAPAFELAADTLRALAVEEGGGTREVPVFSDRQNIPALVDIDCDADPDLFVPSQAGTLTFYENVGLSAAGLPVYEFVPDSSYQGIEIIGGSGKDARALHGAAAVSFADVDGDADPDLFWGDFFSPSLYFLENTGSCAAPALERTSDVFPPADPLMTRGYNAPAFADLDGDADPDLFVGVLGGAFDGGAFAGSNFYFFRNEPGGFTLETRQFIAGLDVGEESAPAFADLDGDGDLDLLVGNKIDPTTFQRAQLFFFRNDGTSTAPAYRLVTDAFVDVPALAFNLAPALGDLDADGDLDLLLGGFDGTLAYYRNDGLPQQPAFARVGGQASPFAAFDVGQSSVPALGDLDADGDLDVLVGGSGGTIHFFRNDGAPGAPAFVLADDALDGIDAGARSAPTLFDVEPDGDLDLFIGTDRDGVRFYRNTGTAQQPAFVADEVALFGDPGATVPSVAVPFFADVDADGDADLFLGGVRGGLFFYRNARVPVATDEVPAPPEERLVVRAAYPNPFRAVTTLRVRVAQAGRVRLTVYDVRGRAVAVPLDAVVPPGEHAVRLDASGLPAGVYFYAVVAGHSARAAGTLLLVK